MATHGYGGLRRWALGSVTDRVVHTATVPVCVVRSAAHVAPGEHALTRILVPLDGSDLARQALPLAIELAKRASAELVVLRAVETHTQNASLMIMQSGVDLIVMATHGYGGLQRWALGSVADKVLQAAPIPILLVRARASTGEGQTTKR